LRRFTCPSHPLLYVYQNIGRKDKLWQLQKIVGNLRIAEEKLVEAK
jgi:hypothetical protein